MPRVSQAWPQAGLALASVAALFAAVAVPAGAASREAAVAAPARPPANFGFTSPVRIARIELDAVDGVFVSDPDRALIRDAIAAQVAAVQPPDGTAAPTYDMLVLLTRFSRGSAAARMSLIGLGSVHVEGRVRLTGADGKPLPEVAISKGLVLGGLAGGLASSDSVVNRFTNAVVASIAPRPGPAPAPVSAPSATPPSASPPPVP